MKSKFEPEQIQNAIDFKSGYTKLLKKDLENLQEKHASADNPTRFIFISAFAYSDMNTPYPLLIVGDFTPAWAKYVKTDLKARKTRDWAVGKCSYDAAKNAFNFEVNKGRVIDKATTAFAKLIQKITGIEFNIVEKLVGDDEDIEADASADDDATEAAPAAAPAKEQAAAPKAAKSAKTKKEAYQAVFVEAAAPLSDLVADVQAKLPIVEKDILPKLKSAQSLNGLDKKDKKAINDINTLCSKFEAAYNSAKKQVKKEFAKAYEQINDIKRQLSPASKPIIVEKIKGRANQFYEAAKQCADKFYAKIKKAAAPEKAVSIMCANMLEIQQKSATNKEISIPTSAILLAAAQRGPNFSLEEAAMIAQKMADKAGGVDKNMLPA